MSELDLEIQRHIIQYLSGSVPLSEFENWFVPILWDLDTESRSTQELAGAVHILLAEYSRGDRTLEAVRAGLAKVAQGSEDHVGVGLVSAK